MKNNNQFETTKQILWYYFDTLNQNEIKDAAKQYYQELKDDIVAVAAFVTVLNHKCWYFYENHQQELSDLYSELYYKYNEKAWNWLEKNGTDEEKHWYFKTMD